MRRTNLPILICIICGLLPSFAASPLDTFLETHCYECHDEDSKKGELDLTNTLLSLDSAKQLDLWTYVHDRIASGEMPPAKEPRPDPADLEAALANLVPKLHAADKAHRETVQRRLNRFEYENTLHDLLHIDTALAELLPEDASVEGFDNIGAALSVSTEQMQAYLAASQIALDAALPENAPEEPETQTITKWLGHDSKRIDTKLASGQWRKTDDDFIIAYSGNGFVPTDVISAPEEGWYDMEFTCRAHNTDGKPLTVAIHQFNYGRRTSSILGFYRAQPGNTVIRQRIRMYKADRLKPLPFDLPYVKGSPEYDGPGLAIGPIGLRGPLLESWPPPSLTAMLGNINPDKATAIDARNILARFLPRAFRRPIAPAEIDPYLALVTKRLDTGRPFLGALKVGLQAALSSPNFLFLVETSSTASLRSGTRKSSDLKSSDLGDISDIQLANRLSYFLWSSQPDDELLSHATSGRLTDPGTLHAQVERLLTNPKSARFTGNFTGQWLRLRDIDFTTPDRSLYPEYDDHLQASLLEESRAFFDEILANDLPVQTFIDSDFAMLNERLARHYDVPGVENFEIQRVSLPPGSPRGGVLTQGSVLKVTANGTNTSPVMRGIWALDNILGKPSPPPPAGVPAVEPDIRGTTTIREQLDAHRDSEKCASCHRKIDPPGFALESFDPIGGYRENYRSMGEGEKVPTLFQGRNVRYKKGLPVDSTGTTPDGHKFADIHDFKALLLEDETVITRTLTRKLLTYALGRPLGFSDRPEVERIVSEVSKSNHGLRTLIHEITQSQSFRTP